MNVEGKGVTSDILRGIGLAFEPFKLNGTITIHECIPKPYPPEYSTYYLICGLCILSWTFSFLEPYGLRVRHIIMRYYYPHIARNRAIWLYNKIIFERSKFHFLFIYYLLYLIQFI